MVNSSESSDCEDNEPPRFHHHHQEIQVRLQQQQLAVSKPPPRHHSGSRPHSSERPHDPFSNNSVAGSDVVDELLKPLQSYFSVFRTGVYDQQGGVDADLMMNGVTVREGGPPAHNTRSQTDKRYKIKKNQGSSNMGNEPRKGRHDIVENGIGGLHHQQGPPPPMKGVVHQQHGGQQVIHTMANQILPNSAVVSLPGGHPGMPPSGVQTTVITGGPPTMMATPGLPSPGAGGNMQGPPPQVVTNGFSQSMMETMETELVVVPSGPPNLNEPPPSLLVEAGQFPPPHHNHTRPMMMMNQMSGPPPSGVMMSPPGAGAPPRLPMFSTPTKEETLQQQMPPPSGSMPPHQMRLQDQQLQNQQQVSDSQQRLTEQLEADISNLSIKDDSQVRQQVINIFIMICIKTVFLDIKDVFTFY